MTRDIEAWKAECESKDATIARLQAELAAAQQTIRDREAELYRVRTTETQAAHEIDASHDHEARARFKDTCDKLARLQAELEEANRERERVFGAAKSMHKRMRQELAAANAVIEKLPVTADGKPVVPGMELWQVDEQIDRVVVWPMEAVYLDYYNQPIHYKPSECYSTHAAAERAAGEVG